MRLTSLLSVLALILGFTATLNQAAAQTAFSWQDPQARVLGTGDLLWDPHPFVYTPGASVIYIDFEGGSDGNTGTSTASAFKHHPWDANATGNALAASGVKTYVFKRGVIYRGTLVAKESGTAGNPIRLTSDPSWGTGNACLFGSERVTTAWTRCTAADVRNIPNPTGVWYTDLNFSIVDFPYNAAAVPHVYAQTVCEINGATIKRINLARAPNWNITDSNDVMLNWWTSGSSPVVPGTYTTTVAADWIGGTVWNNWGTGSSAGANMSTVTGNLISGYNAGTLTLDGVINTGCKFFVENLPQLLDTANEYYYSDAGRTAFARRLYLRLSGDRDPNTVAIEVAARHQIISIVDKHDITISGLFLGINNQPRPGVATDPPHWNNKDGACQAVTLGGTVSAIEISNCTFRFTGSAVAPRRDDAVNPSFYDGIRITDNDIAFNDDQAITLGTNGRVRNAFVLRNNLYHIGMRQTTRNYSAIPAINVAKALSAEIAGNVVNFCAGSGINTDWGAGTGTTAGIQVRGLVHHNKVTTSALMLNDYGGIEGWGEGPVYFFSNVSGNSRGFRSFSGQNEYNPWGHNFYFDHAANFKALNNIAWGVHNSTTDAAQRNNSGFMQAVCGMNFYANNTCWNLYRAFCFNSQGASYLGNLMDNISYQYHDESGNEVGDLTYAKNVYRGTPVRFNSANATMSAFQTYLQNGNARSWQLGTVATSAVMVDPANHDFRPAGEAIGNGAKVFSYWNLPSPGGVWNFCIQNANPALVKGEGTSGYGIDLTATGATAGDYIDGALENWTKGAMRFNGTSRFATTTSTSLDMATNGFIIEVYLRTTSGGVVAAKGGATGYALDVPATGKARIRVKSGGGEYNLSSTASVNDNAWHHVVAEVNRASSAANIWIDGVLSNGAVSGVMPAAGTSLTNTNAFFVGKDESGNFFGGDIDFLQVARNTFAFGGTSLGELYAWEFDGPGVRDFAWKKAVGARDAGALNYTTVGTIQGVVQTAAMPGVSVRYLSSARKFVVNLGSGFTAAEPVRLKVFNMAGRQVWDKRTVTSRSGTGRIEISASKWAGGAYLLRITSTARVQVVRLSTH